LFFTALATDYDGTLASHGVVSPAAIDALKRVKQSGRKLLLVTGRELPDLGRVFSQLELFDLVVAENGALLFDPSTRSEKLLASPPSAALVQRLQAQDIPLCVGRSIVATYEPHETAVLTAIRDLGLELQIIFNKGAVMVLPSNVNKATGLKAALDRLSLSPRHVVGVGDAENDHAFLLACGCAVAVNNALPALKAEADIVTRGAEGAGVVELIARLVDTDLDGLRLALPRARPIPDARSG
jgi:hydroxymethylpyrimidine pyrophosphatase-like HAD family hydrolase